ncbi:hypothetical protein CRN67_01940 [Campylobacter blaseri]|uniref:M23ase beta-sheet core domain-containing protein n=2 Tax=Campylobacter blaseri TaxID=2042961 RepID=A0A2P8R2R4_9BACT|nr:hypothetical protein CQ405_01940 [Campylobacter blaseri]PSM54429.1 hypothetical protein CRN67_01940 [Campylobacter blaseri]
MGNLKLFIGVLVAIFIIIFLLLIFLVYKNSNMKKNISFLYTKNIELFKANNELTKDKADLNRQLNGNDDVFSELRLALELDSVVNSLNESGDGRKIGMDKKLEGKFVKSIPNGVPLNFKGITDNYGIRIHPISKVEKFHQGIDLRASVGTPLYATANGVVEYSGMTSSGYGYLVIISHNFGFETRYAHMQNKQVVRAGEFIKKGDLIGYSGNTGYSTGPHLHYEVRFLSRTLDPINFMKFNNIFYDERKVPWQALVKAIDDF